MPNKNHSESIRAKNSLLPQTEFLRKYHITAYKFNKTNIKWETLEHIYSHYESEISTFETAAEGIVKILLTKRAKDAGVHSVRYRVKEPEKLIEKIIRKRIDDPKRVITLSNYQDQITDLIGIRALHIFKNDWLGIHLYLKDIFPLKRKSKPIIYHRKGDEIDLRLCKAYKCDIKEHERLYRSVHYLVMSHVTKQACTAEIQVRTIFEEGWSEIDHKMKYGFKQTHSPSSFDSHLSILNRIAGSADEIGSLIKMREEELSKLTYEKYNDSKHSSN